MRSLLRLEFALMQILCNHCCYSQNHHWMRSQAGRRSNALSPAEVDTKADLYDRSGPRATYH